MVRSKAITVSGISRRGHWVKEDGDRRCVIGEYNMERDFADDAFQKVKIL